MTFKISVNVNDVSRRPVANAQVHIGSTVLTTDDNGQTAAVPGSSAQTVSVEHPDFVSASSSVSVTPSGKGLKIQFDPLQVVSTQWYPNGSDFTVQVWFILGQLDDVPGYVEGDYAFIKEPWAIRTSQASNNVLGASTGGWERFLTNRVETNLRSQGRYFAAIWKNKSGKFVPQLVSMWVPNACTSMLTNGKQFGGPSYLLYFTPKIPDGVSDSYPSGEFYRKLGDRYLFSSKMTAHHMHAQGRAGIIVVPIGQRWQPFDPIGTRSGALRLLREVSHYVRRKAKAPIATQFTQDVSAVALAGFSGGTIPGGTGGGGTAICDILTTPGLDVDAEYFYARALREIYHFDCDPDHTSTYVSAVLNWYANPAGAKGMRNYRIYTAKTWGEPLRSFHGTDNAVGGASERHDGSRSYVFVGAGTIDPVLRAAWAHPDVEKSALPVVLRDGTPEAHQFFSYFFPGHAIGHSDIF
jgi:hypothetical protein